MKNTVCIDWLSYTGQSSQNGTGIVLPPWENQSEAQADIPRFGYRKALRFPSGLVVMFDGSTATMGQHYIYSGQALANLNAVYADGGMTALQWHEGKGHKCTRIDLAIDVRDEPQFLPQIKGKVERNEFGGTCRHATIVSSSDGIGLTCYMGSRSSERFVRIYDKGAQLKSGEVWTRIEAEIKHDSARTVSRAILGVGASGVSLVAQSVISRVCDFDDPTWKEIVSGDKIPIGTPKIEEKQTEAWILSQVAKAIAKFERQYPDRHILDRLCRAVDDMLGE